MQRHLTGRGVAPDKARAAARSIAEVFGKLKDAKNDNPARIEQLAFLSPEEQRAALDLAERLAAGEAIDVKKARLPRRTDTAAEITGGARIDRPPVSCKGMPNLGTEETPCSGHAG